MNNILKSYPSAQHRLNAKLGIGLLQEPPHSPIKKFFTKLKLVPATLAILVQCAALISVIATALFISLVYSTYFNATLNFSMVSFVLMQALFATLFAYLVGMAVWWRWIHFGFPLAMLAMSHWQIPNEVYLAGFIISLSLFWTTFRSQVPFYPSRPIVWRQVANLIAQDKPVRLIDIGSGLGDMAMHIAKLSADNRVEGIEIAPLPWLISVVRAKMRRSSAVFKMGDYRALDFANYDVIFAYLSPAAMLTLWEKASQEMLPNTMLISLEFEIPGVLPSMTIAKSKKSPAIYVWKIP